MAHRILVVEDDKAVAETLRAVFASEGYLATCAHSGEEAIARAGSFLPNLLVCDVIMSGLNGFETALRVKELCPECALLLLSGHSVAAQIAERFTPTFRDRGFLFELLAKPISPDELLDRVKNALSGV
jgi:CheY-like chemotaxis protein